MSESDRFEALMLEHLYGLLEADEVRELQVYLATPAGADLRARAEEWKDKLTGAAKTPFDHVRFVPPVTIPASKEKTAVSGPRRVAIKSVWTRWAVAASLVLVVVGLGGPAGYQFMGWYAQSRQTNEFKTALYEKRGELRKLEVEHDTRRVAIQKEHADALAAHQAAQRAYRDALASSTNELSKKDFTVRLTGPDRVQPGAPNAWTIETLDKNGRNTLPRKMDVIVRDQSDVELLRQTHDHPTEAASLRLPSSFWEKVKPGSDLFLEVVAYADDNRTSALTERLPLARPVYVTHLVTDKPLYRPGETVRYRSLTLDRATLQPPMHDQYLKFKLTKPDGAAIFLDDANGRVVQGGKPVNGPDGKPVRGIGVGEYELPDDFPGGEYTLELAEVTVTGEEKVLDTRKFLVASYTVDVFEKKLEFEGKSYGPGDEVRARIEVARASGAPLKNTRAVIVASADGREFFTEKSPRFEANLDTQTRQPKTAVCYVRFKLPVNLKSQDELAGPVLSVTIQDGTDSETIVRPIPLVEKELRVEFFPEGGDLVEGLPCRVYFQVRTPSGKPADLTGVITDGTNTVAEVATLTDAELAGVKRGQGVFTLTPKAGTKYFLKLKTPVGITEPTKEGFPLPEAKADGIVLTALDAVTEKGSAIRIAVQAAKGPKTLHVGAYARGRLISHQRIDVEAGKPVELKLQGDEALGGVTRITVFEEPKADTGKRANLIPRAERLVYRKPGEQLVLTANLDKDSYSPSAKVALELAARNEKGQPTPAILLVGVVNQSVIAMADDKTERQLPTHFLLAGEVKNPAELEHADFLLTDHPKAGVALDLLLGTQGWRRFAEQNVLPKDPTDREEVERMLVAHGQRSSAPLERYRLEEQRVTAEYRPKLEQSAIRVKNAQSAKDVFRTNDEPDYQSRLAMAQGYDRSAEAAYSEAAAELYKFETRASGLRSWGLPAFFLGLLALSVGGIAFAVTRQSRERRPYFATAAGALVAASLAIVGIVLTRGTDAAESAYIAAVRAEQQKRAGVTNMAKTPSPAPAERRGPGTTPPKSKGTEFMPAKGVLPPDAKIDGPDDQVPDPRWNLKGRPPVTGQGPKVASEKFAQKIPDLPGLPPAAPPSIVREYAHERNPSLGVRGDLTETVYWHPVLVLPETGRTTVEFQLSDHVARFRVLVAGHSTDGRIGAKIITIEVVDRR